MGKTDEQQLPVQQRDADVAAGRGGSGNFLCQRCTVVVSRIFRRFSFKCVAILLLSFAIFVSPVFWIFPVHSKLSAFDANQFIKHSASVQAYFSLQKPVSDLIPHISRLEYEINEEVGVPRTKVAILSMQQAGASNWTGVVFGFLSDPMNASIDPVSFSVLKLSLIDLFFQEPNMTLTNSTFGQPSSFQILKFPGGITIIPKQSASIWQIPQILFNFTLNNSIFEINENYFTLKEQLKLGLHLWPHENVYVQVSNKNGSTTDPPVIVEASVTSEYGGLPSQRLKQLAQIITGSPSGKNLGLNNSVFGKVKEVSLSSYLNHSIDAAPTSPSPAPSPVQNDYLGPSISPSPSPLHRCPLLPPCVNCGVSVPSGSGLPPRSESEPPQSLLPKSSSPAPMASHCGSQLPPSPSPSLHAPNLPPQDSSHLPLTGPTFERAPAPSPLPDVSPGTSGGFASISPTQSSTTVGSSHKEIWWLCLSGSWVFYLLCWRF